MAVQFPGCKAPHSGSKGIREISPFLRTLAISAACSIVFSIPASATFTHFEARQTHSLTLTPNKERLLAVNSIDARLCVYDVSDGGSNEPILYAEIPVGLEPVAVAAATNDEAWVINEVSDTVSVVSLSRRVVEATLNVPDEPSDVVFAGGKAFVSCARNKLIRVFDVATRTEVATIPVEGIEPRALAVNPSGTKVFVAFLMSGNQTTIVPADKLPFPPAPQPRTALIVPASDSRITYTVLDHDVAQIDVGTHVVDRYFSNSGNSLMDVAVHPQTGDIWTANMDPKNLVATEPALKGHVVDHRITRINVNSGAAESWDLNPGVDYNVLPNPTASAQALAEPRAIVFSDQGTKAWVAAFGSDRVACIDATTGAITARVNLRTGSESARNMRGPRALALAEDRKQLYVLNKLSNTISVVNTLTATLMAEVQVGSHDPMPTAIKEGRGFLFDARLSGNGTVSCSVCHLDADRDGIAWDLGVPGGATTVVMGKNLSIHDTETLYPRTMHPLKGPMTTQTLRGLKGGGPFHWRGDKAGIADFNPTFHNLLGGEQIAAAEMQDMETYLFSIRLHSNPNLLRSGSPPTSFEGGFPTIGRDKFGVHNNHCGVCHEGERGTNNNIDLANQVGSAQPLMTPHLRTVYQRMDFNPKAGQTSLSGFGILHDGTGFSLPIGHPYVLSELTTAADFANVRAYVLNFPTGTPPAVGVTISVTWQNLATAPDEINEMENLANEGDIDFTVRGLYQGQRRSFIYNKDLGLYLSDVSGEPGLSQSELLNSMGESDVLEFMGTPPEEGARFATDRDSDGTPDADEQPPELVISNAAPAVRLEWNADPVGWALERSPTPEGTWDSAGGARQKIGPVLRRDETPVDRMFYRLKRTW